MSNQKLVIIVGSGVSGLAAANELLENGYNVKVLEARNIHGGRIGKNTTFANFPIELGAEEIHVKNSKYYELVKKSGLKLISDKQFIHYIEDVNKEEIIEREEFMRKYKLDDFYSKTKANENLISYGISVKEYLLQQNIDEKFFDFYKHFWATENGSELDQMGLKEYMDFQKGFSSDHDRNFLIKDGSHFDFLEKNYSQVLPLIEYNCPVTKVNFEGDQVLVYDNQGRVHIASSVILTVPITQLKNGSITFEPQLPEEKIKAINSIQMGKGGKLFLKFKRKFWKRNMGILFIKTQIGFLWDCSSLRSNNQYVLGCLVSGQTGLDMNEENKRKQILKELMEKLGKLFGFDNSEELLEDYLWIEYSQIKYIEGTYSQPSLNAEGSRKILQQSLKNKVFFAGEATHHIYFQTANGALDTGIREALKIIQKDKEEERMRRQTTI